MSRVNSINIGFNAILSYYSVALCHAANSLTLLLDGRKGIQPVKNLALTLSKSRVHVGGGQA